MSEATSTAADRAPEYNENSVAFTRLVWGDGFLSPGGPEEVARILDGADLTGCEVLDIGCGLGGVDVELVRTHGARRVTGIDVEAMQVEHAAARAAREALADRLDVRLVEPGPLPFPDGVFDAVFSKDSIVHVADKAALFAEARRVLKPGGRLLASDWLARGAARSADLEALKEAIGLDFRFATPEATHEMLEQAGFADVRLRDRQAWYREEARRELARISGPLYTELVQALGAERADNDIACWRTLVRTLDSGAFGPSHIRARKPG